MTLTSYKPLFGVECLHGYFTDRVCKALTLEPTASSRRIFQRYQLLFEPLPGGGRVHYCEQAPQQLRRLSRETTPFAFALKSTDDLFDIYTETDLTDGASPGQTVYYFSNRAERPAEIYGRERLLLHEPARPTAQSPLVVRAAVFTHRFEQPVRAATLHVVDLPTGRPVWAAPPLPEEGRAWSIDLRGQPCGRYQLRADGTVALDFYLSEAPAVRQWGVVEVFAGLDQEIPNGCQVVDEDGRPTPRTFTIAFTSRETIWRYYIVGQPGTSARDAGSEIVGARKRSNGTDRSSNGDIHFVAMPDRTLNGRPAAVFESIRPLPLSELYTEDDYFFTFRANGRSEPGVRAVKLPFAQPGTTKFDMAPSGPRMCSEIYVYL